MEVEVNSTGRAWDETREWKVGLRFLMVLEALLLNLYVILKIMESQWRILINKVELAILK